MIDGIGDDEIENAVLSLRGACAALAHAVANHFAAAEGDFVAVYGEVLLDFDHQFGVGQPDAVAGGGAVEVGVGTAWDCADS